VHDDELGGRCGCSKRNKPARHFDCGASSTASHVPYIGRFLRWHHISAAPDSRFEIDRRTSRCAQSTRPSHAHAGPRHEKFRASTVNELRLASDCPKTGN
jgi:hypothetical protein